MTKLFAEDSQNKNQRPELVIPLAERPFISMFLVLVGIILPIITLSVELYAGICAMEFFNPIPTVWHVLLVAFVPILNSYIFWILYNEKFQKPTLLAWASLASISISLFYAIVFAPLMPIGFLAILLIGIGLLPLAPSLSLLAIFVMRREIIEAIGKSFPLTWKGSLIGLLMVIGIVYLSESNIRATRLAIEEADSSEVVKQIEALRFLRNSGDSLFMRSLVNSPYSRNLTITEATESFFKGEEEARIGNWTRRSNNEQVFYRLNGETYNEYRTKGHANTYQDPSLQLVASQIDGSIDNDASLGYLEWTFVFKNTSDWQREATSDIKLPKGGVVSRLTLWINGEEREAAYAENNRVIRAYESVTAKRRDPVLVTKSGKDLVHMKAFPIEPNGGEMKVRIGITFPLEIENEKSGLVDLPQFEGHNFLVPETTKHIVWFESKNKLESANQNLRFEKEGKITAIRGNLSNDEIKQVNTKIRATKNENKFAWTKDESNLITQKVEVRKTFKPTRFIFAIDTSKRFKTEKENIISLIKNLPQDNEIGLVLSGGNGLNTEIVYPNSFVGSPTEIAEKINQANFDGGTDNMPALAKASQIAQEKEGSVVIALYAPQPFNFATTLDNSQYFTRRINNAKIYRFVSVDSYDAVEESLKNYEILQTPPRYSDLKTDVETFLSQLKEENQSFQYIREKAENIDISDSKETSKHLIRLWANDEVSRILEQEKDEKKAVELAQKYQLVTPVTGAVVLETQQQYDQFGLKPVDNATVPTIPEPETYLLIAIVLGVLVWLIATRKLF